MFTLLLALVLDWLVGDPDGIWKRWPHPVVTIGKSIDWLDSKLNRADVSAEVQSSRGVQALVLIVAVAFAIGSLASNILEYFGFVGWLAEIAVVSVFIAQKSMVDHVNAVFEAWQRDGLAGARVAVSHIVGRDPNTLDESGVSRATIETLAENFSDGVVAPVFWYAVLGLPGIIAYKTINTADSMIGHRSPKYQHFGWAAAVTDDLVNWPAARISAGLIAIGAGFEFGWQRGRRALDTAFRDSGLHRSPNAGWPESAMAGALEIALGGPRAYQGASVNETRLNAGQHRELGRFDAKQALTVFRFACFTLWGLVGLIWLLF